MTEKTAIQGFEVSWRIEPFKRYNHKIKLTFKHTYNFKILGAPGDDGYPGRNGMFGRHGDRGPQDKLLLAKVA